MNSSDWGVGLSTSFDSPRIPAEKCLTEHFLKAYADAGIRYVEVSMNPEAIAQTYFPKNPELYGEYCIRAGIVPWSFHLPFSQDIDISRTDYKGKESVSLDKEFIRLSARAGIKVAVIHPSSEPIADADRHARLKSARSALRELAAYSESLGVHLAIEDLPRTCLGRCSADMLYLLEGHDDLNICFDTNHLLMEDNLSFINVVGHKIMTLHVSDYDFIDERHLLPLKGKNDWGKILTALEKAGYHGPFLYEVSGNSSELSYASFVENYHTLIALKERS